MRKERENLLKKLEEARKIEHNKEVLEEKVKQL
jgi:SMC interacting uncharacterized protein involved in chromosome segregation